MLTGFDSQLGKGKARTARAEARGHGAVIRALRVLRGQNVESYEDKTSLKSGVGESGRGWYRLLGREWGTLDRGDGVFRSNNTAVSG